MEANKWITDKTFAYTLHETGRFVKGEPELCNKFYFRIYPDYAHGITDEDAAKVVSELINAKEDRDSLMEALDAMLDTFVYNKKATTEDKFITLEFAMKTWASMNTHAFPSIGQIMNAQKIKEAKGLLTKS